MSEEVVKPVKRKPVRNKPGWGRTFSKDCRYKDDAVYWKLYDLIILRDPHAIFKIKGPHRRQGKFKEGEEIDGVHEE